MMPTDVPLRTIAASSPWLFFLRWFEIRNGSENPFRTKTSNYFIGGLVEQSLLFHGDDRVEEFQKG